MITEIEAKQHIKDLFEFIGENPDREGLKDTPDRILRMWTEIFRGYDKLRCPKVTTFQNGADGITYDSMIVDTGDYYSLCEHHSMPFFGKYWFAYIPNPQGKILGLSKIGRVVDYCAAKLQIQERLVSDIVTIIQNALGDEFPPLGIALIMKGRHLCKEMRGARKQGEMTSSYLTGLFKVDSTLRNEFLSIAR
jgi:GTP cyclohydrolase I